MYYRRHPAPQSQIIFVSDLKAKQEEREGGAPVVTRSAHRWSQGPVWGGAPTPNDRRPTASLGLGGAWPRLGFFLVGKTGPVNLHRWRSRINCARTYACLLVREISWSDVGRERKPGRLNRQNKAHIRRVGPGQRMDTTNRKTWLHHCFLLQWHRAFVSRSKSRGCNC